MGKQQPESSSRQPRVLVIDDEASMRELLEIVLGNDGYAVHSAADVAEARSLLESAAPNE